MLLWPDFKIQPNSSSKPFITGSKYCIGLFQRSSLIPQIKSPSHYSNYYLGRYQDQALFLNQAPFSLFKLFPWLISRSSSFSLFELLPRPDLKIGLYSSIGPPSHRSNYCLGLISKIEPDSSNRPPITEVQMPPDVKANEGPYPEETSGTMKRRYLARNLHIGNVTVFKMELARATLISQD